jgi:hypothetical protein
MRPRIRGLSAEAICLCLIHYTDVWNEALCVCLIHKTRVWNEASDPMTLGRSHLFVFVRLNWCIDWGTLCVFDLQNKSM